MREEGRCKEKSKVFFSKELQLVSSMAALTWTMHCCKFSISQVKFSHSLHLSPPQKCTLWMALLNNTNQSLQAQPSERHNQPKANLKCSEVISNSRTPANSDTPVQIPRTTWLWIPSQFARAFVSLVGRVEGVEARA